ncbi:MAG TPA: hypothetical protein VFM16_09165 [Holophagaceae bacterium]|nr:hypothetical protein [Holophagaceae bacterium]
MIRPGQRPLLQRIAGLLAGWLACVFLVATVEGTIKRSPVPLPAAWITPGAAFIAAFIGGYLCALIARDRTMPRVLIGIVLISGLAYGASPAAGEGVSPVLLALLGAAGVYLGAWTKDG